MAFQGTNVFLGSTLVGQTYLGDKQIEYTPYNVAPTYIVSSSVMLLDAGNSSSYPGTGNTWFDLSGNGNNANVSLITSYYTASNGGAFDFPGTDYTKIATVTQSGSLNNAFAGDWTLDMWLTLDSYSVAVFDTLAGPFSKDDWFDNPGIGMLFVTDKNDANIGRQSFYTNNVSNFSASSGRVLDPFTTGSYFNLQYVRSGGTIRVYSNTVLLQTITNATASYANSNNFIIGRARNDATANYMWFGKIAVMTVYQSALTTTDLAQNYNALKGRYGY